MFKSRSALSVLLRLISLVAWSLWATATLAQVFPNKPVKVIVTFPPGGTPDIYGRILAQELSTLWKQNVVVENKTVPPAPSAPTSSSRRRPTGTRCCLPQMLRSPWHPTW